MKTHKKSQKTSAFPVCFLSDSSPSPPPSRRQQLQAELQRRASMPVALPGLGAHCASGGEHAMPCQGIFQTIEFTYV